MEKEACCETMKYHINDKCDIHKNPFDCSDAVIYSSKKKFGLIIHDGGSSYLKIKYCPWCANKLKKKKLDL